MSIQMSEVMYQQCSDAQDVSYRHGHVRCKPSLPGECWEEVNRVSELFLYHQVQQRNILTCIIADLSSGVDERLVVLGFQPDGLGGIGRHDHCVQLDGYLQAAAKMPAQTADCPLAECLGP